MSEIYADAEQFEHVFTRLFERIAEDDPNGMDSLVKKRMVIRFRVTDPDVDLWVDGRSRPVTTAFGAQDLKPTLSAQLTADTLHELLLGTLPLGKGLSGGRLKVKGSIFKAMKLEDLLHSCQTVYPELAEELDAG